MISAKPNSTDKNNLEEKDMISLVVKSIQHRITEKRNAEIVVKIRSGKIVEYTNTDIVRLV